MSAEDPGCIHGAGALKDGKLSPETYNQIIEDIKRAGEIGFANVSLFPCSANIPPAIGIVPQDLEDKDKYPEFHKDIMGMFEKVALTFDIKGNYLSILFPFWDPFSLALKLGLDIPTFNIPDLPFLTPPDLALALNIKLPDLMKLAISLPGIPKLPTVPMPKLPDYNLLFPPGLDARFQFDLGLWNLLVPPQIPFPSLPDLPKLIALPPDICFIIEPIVKAGIFGPAEAGDLSKVIAVQVLATFTGQCATVAVTSQIIGDGGKAGVTGQMGKSFGWQKAVPAEGNDMDAKARNVIIEAFKQEFNREPTLKEAQFVQIIARMENGYGKAWAGTKKAEWPPDATSSNNWGNIHGTGPAGSFTYIDYDSNNKPYSTKYAKYGSPTEGARALIKQLYVRRPYILDAIQNDKSLYKPIYLMSSRAVYGDPGYKTGKVSPNAIIPPDKGGLTYYEAPPEFYLGGPKDANGKGGARGCLKLLMKVLKEGTDFDIDAKSNVPFDPSNVQDTEYAAITASDA